jgi:hypothetical protein
VPAAAAKLRSDVRQVIEDLRAFSTSDTLDEGVTIRERIAGRRRF